MYYRKEIMEKKRKKRELQEIQEILGYSNNRNNDYKLYDSEESEGNLTYEPVSNPASSSYVVNNNEAQRMKNTKVNSQTANQIRENANEFRRNNQKKNKKNSKKKKKGIIVGTISLVLAGIMAVSGFLIYGKLRKKNGNGTSNSTSQGLSTGSLDLLGEELSKDGYKKSEYTKVSGDFNIEDVVRGADGLLYVDAESAANATKSGTSVIDTKGGSLVVSDNGKVYTREQGYEIVDSNGNVVESGNGSPSNSNEGINYVECPCNYYDDEGNLVHSAGEFITQQELERCRQYYHTSKPKKDEYTKVEEEIIYYDNYTTENSNSNSSSEENDSSKNNADNAASTGSKEDNSVTDNENYEEVTYEEENEDYQDYSSSSNEGVFNADGTYTIYGVTYASYADYQQYIMDGGAGYGYFDGMVQPIGDYEIENQYTL